jgi:hypothetical protein
MFGMGKKRETFNRVEDARPVNDVPDKVLESKNTIFMEMDMYVPEIIILALLTFNGMIMLFLEMTGASKGSAFILSIVLLAAMWGLFMFKSMVYQPRGKKSIVLRCGQNGSISIGIQKIKDKMIGFDNKNEESQKIQITGIRKHWHNLTGRPVVVIAEDWPENVSIIQKFKPTMQSKDFSTILTNSYQTGYETGRNSIQRKGTPFLNANIILIIVLIAMIALGFIMFQQMGILEKIAGKLGVEAAGLFG